MAPTQTSTQLAVSSEALELSVPVQTLSAVSNGRESEPSAWLAAHAAGRRWSESWMREIRTSSSMRGRWKRATTQRACALLYRSPWLVSLIKHAETRQRLRGESLARFLRSRSRLFVFRDRAFPVRARAGGCRGVGNR